MREAADAAGFSPPLRVASSEALTDLATLSGILGPLDRVAREPMRTPGFSGSSHERLIAHLRSGEMVPMVLKRTPLAGDWMARRTGDRTGREAALLAESALAGVWQAFDCPYLAYAIEPGAIALLMRDVGAHMLPDRREPMSEEHEERLLGSVAAMHARFWDSPALGAPWLAPPQALIGLLAPAAVSGLAAEDRGHPVISRALAGWEVAFRHLSAAQASVLRQPVEALAARTRDLPHTLIHGDCKVANFAFLPDGRASAFDWALVARAPVTLELGWYQAVNASRVSAGKDASLARYRAALDRALGERAPDEAAWRRIETESALAGAAMLLWSKALALEEGTPQARAEWEWYVERLPRG